MVFRSILAILVSLVIFAAPAKACTTLDQFVDGIKPAASVILLAKASAVKKITDTINKNRAIIGKEPIEATAFLLAAVENGDGTIALGVVLFSEAGCAIEETAVVLSQEQWATFTQSAGLVDSDFAILSDT